MLHFFQIFQVLGSGLTVKKSKVTVRKSEKCISRIPPYTTFTSLSPSLAVSTSQLDTKVIAHSKEVNDVMA